MNGWVEKTAKSKSEFPFAVGIPAFLWQGLFFYLPLAFLLISSFLQTDPFDRVEGMTLSHIKMFLTPTYFGVILSSLSLALTNAILCLCIAYPLAYFLAFIGKKYKNFLLFILIVPFWTNFLLHVYAWYYVLEKHGMVNTFLLKIGLISSPLPILNSPTAILIMMVYYYLPFMVLPIYSALERFNYSLIEASLDLGGSFFTTFRKILIPLSSRGMIAGFFLVFIPSFGEFAIPDLMGGDKKMFVGTVVSQYILGEGTGSLGAAFTLVSGACLVLASGMLYVLLSKLLRPHDA